MTKVSADSDILQDIEEARNRFCLFLNEEQCGYVWIQGISERFVEQYGDMFSGELTENSLWRVTGEADEMMMQLAE